MTRDRDRQPPLTQSLRDIGGYEPPKVPTLHYTHAEPWALAEDPPAVRIRKSLEMILEHTARSDLDNDPCRTHLSALAELRQILRPAVDNFEYQLADAAFAHGATYNDLAEAADLTPQGARSRWPDFVGDQVVVVISRRDRRHRAVPGDPRGMVGEVGGSAQYDSDRGWWRIGADVRTKARYAVIAVDETVRRVYEIDPDGWIQDPSEPRLWQFSAIGGQPLDYRDVRVLWDADALPFVIGGPCPTKPGGAYRPHRF